MNSEFECLDLEIWGFSFPRTESPGNKMTKSTGTFTGKLKKLGSPNFFFLVRHFVDEGLRVVITPYIHVGYT